MSAPDQQQPEQGEFQPQVRSGIKLQTNAKGLVQVTLSVYAGEEEGEMQRLKDLAVRTYEATVRELGANAARVA